MRCLPFLLLASPALSEVPAVVADTPAVHSLVAQVMKGVGEPVLLLPPGASVHDAALRPSDARALAEADVVVWTGEALLPRVGEAVAGLAPEARVLALLDAPGWEPLPAREGTEFVVHADEGDEHADEASHEEAGHEAHDHGAVDPHAWLDPAVAAAWMGAVAEDLAAADPANAAAYRANAVQAGKEVLALGDEIRARLLPLAGRGYAVGHDAFQYFERAAGLPAAFAVARADGAEPSPGDVAALRTAVEAGEVACVLSDAEAGPDWALTLIEGTEAGTAAADPEGLTLTPGPDLYAALLTGLADALEGCLSS
jgi:zinc transport system substrate-binding protein